MSIFKRLFNFSKPSPALKTSDESEVEKELAEAKAELDRVNALIKQQEEELKDKRKRADRMKQAEKEVISTFKSLDLCDKRREELALAIQETDEEIEDNAYSALQTAKRLKEKRINKMLGLATNPAPTTTANLPATTPASTSSSSSTLQTTSEFLNQLPLTSFRCKECPDCRHPNTPRATECEICGHKF